MQSLQVEGQTYQAPLTRHGCQATQRELPEPQRFFDNANDFEYGDGGRRLTIRLRPGITFHDGTWLDAGAVQSSFERLQRLGVSPLLNDLRDVTVTAQPDGRGVVFTLTEPDYDFARLVLSNSYAAIVSPQAGDPAEPGFVACTGPYRFAPDLYRPGEALTLVRYSDYHWPPAYFANRGAAHIPQIRFIFEAEQANRLNVLLNGEGCVLSLSEEQVAAVAALPRFRFYEATGGVTYLGFNFQRPRWQDVRVRQAIAMALDKTALAQLGPFLVADTPLAPSAVGYDPQAAAFGYGYDPDQGRTLLVQASFDADTEVVLLIPESNTYRELVAAVQQQLQAAGLRRIQVRETPQADILTQRQDFDLLLFDYAWGTGEYNTVMYDDLLDDPGLYWNTQGLASLHIPANIAYAQRPVKPLPADDAGDNLPGPKFPRTKEELEKYKQEALMRQQELTTSGPKDVDVPVTVTFMEPQPLTVVADLADNYQMQVKWFDARGFHGTERITIGGVVDENGL